MSEGDKKTPEELRAVVDNGGASLISTAILSGDLDLLKWAVDINVKAHGVVERVIEEQANQSSDS
jgi:hypothetical protein